MENMGVNLLIRYLTITEGDHKEQENCRMFLTLP